LNGSIAEKIKKFKARLEEPDPEKRVYGASMAAKVTKCLDNYRDLLQKFATVEERVAEKYVDFAVQQAAVKAEEERKIHEAEQERLRREEEEKRRLDEIEAERARKAAEAAAQEEKERHQMYLRRQERERTNHHSKEEEARKEIEFTEKRVREKLEEDMHMRLKKEGAREEKRRRLGNLVEQHKQVKQKGEQQLVAEAIAASLKEANSWSHAEKPKEDTPQPSNTNVATTETSVPSDTQETSMDLPPAADLETEEMLIQQAIELSLQLSTTATQLATQSNTRAKDNTPEGAPQS
jgi:hypothetical protein